MLELELRLLLLRYGRRLVLETLASLGTQTIEDFEREISAIEDRRDRRAHKTAPSARTLIMEAFRDRPEVIIAVETLVANYEKRTFLPQMRDVQRFLNRYGEGSGRLRSRRTALTQLIEALAKMTPAQIADLSKTSEGSNDSDYALLAREIMKGEPTRRHRDRGTERSKPF